MISIATRALAPLAAIVATFGCYAEPYCAVTGGVTGNFSGQIDWRGVGEGQCALTYDNDGIEMGNSLGDRISINAEEFLGATLDTVGQYTDMRVTFESGGREWNASDCVVSIASVVREDWTRSDYLYITGTVSCPTLTSDDASSLSLVGVGFTGYFIEEGLF